MTEEQYNEIIRRLAHGEVVHLPDLGVKIGEVKLSIGSISRDQAKKLYQERECEKMTQLLREIK